MFNKLVKTKHPTIYFLISKLKILHNSTSLSNLSAKLTGARKKQRKVDEDKDFRIEIIKEEYRRNKNFADFFLAMSVQVQFPYDN